MHEPGGVPHLVRLLTSVTYLRYIAVSAGALMVDFIAFAALMRAGLPPISASASGYALGIVFHWLLSSRLVFGAGAAARGPERLRQKGLFLGSALIGLLLTTLIVGGGAALGMEPHVAKLVAIAVSFQATYVLRKTLVFAA